MNSRKLRLILACCIAALLTPAHVELHSNADGAIPARSSSGPVARLGSGAPGPGDAIVQPTLSPPAAQPSPAAPPPPSVVVSPVSVVGSGSQPGPTVALWPASCGPLDDFERLDTWTPGERPNGTLAQSPEQRFSGSFSGRLSYVFPGSGDDYVTLQRTIPMGGRGTALTIWVYGDGSGHHLSAVIRDGAGEVWRFPFGQINHLGWQQMTAPLDVNLPWPNGHIGGPADGVLDYPIQFEALVLDDTPDTFVGSGAIFVDDLACSEASGDAGMPLSPAFILNGSLAGNAGGLIGGTLGDLIKASAVTGPPGGSTAPGAVTQTGTQAGGAQAQPGGPQPGTPQAGGWQSGGKPGGAQTAPQTGFTGSTPTCSLSVISPLDKSSMPDEQPILFDWSLNRTLAPDEYFFVIVTYPSQGRYAMGGTFTAMSVPGKEVMDAIRYNRYVMGRSKFNCSDTGQYHWQIQVRHMIGSSPVSSDPIECFVSGGLTWKPWQNCVQQPAIAVAPTNTSPAPGIAVLATATSIAPTVAASPIAAQPKPFSAAPCGLTLVSPRHGTQLGPEAKPLSLVWHYDRALPDNQYFFAEVQYIQKTGGSGGTRYQIGSYADAANRIPEDLRWAAQNHGEWTVPDMLCLPGFSDDGWYQWTISVREKVMAQPSSFDKVICQGDSWSFNWAGCEQTNTSTCQLTMTSPPNNGEINSESRSAVLGWQLDRALTPEEYYFATVTYSHGGQQQRNGSWDETGYISNLREPRLALWKPYILCADDGWYTWTVYVARRRGAQPSADDTIVCQSGSGRFQWAPCKPTDYQPQTQAQPTPAAPSAGCQLTLLGPPSGVQFGPETENVVLQWQNDRPLNAQEYFFVNVEYPHGGQTWYDGTWRDAAQQSPDGTRDTQFALRSHLCQPGFSDTGQYSWYVAVMHQFGAEKSLHDGVLCQSEKRVFSWTGCAPPPTPEPEYEDEDDSYWDEDD